MTEYRLAVTLLSDMTCGRGDGMAGLVDQEVVHDAAGFPYIHGRTLKGLLREECENLVAVLPAAARNHWRKRVDTLFGRPGSTDRDHAALHIDHAVLPADLRGAVAAQVRGAGRERLTPDDVLSALTAIRRQTAVDPRSGAPLARSLRSMRVVVRGLTFSAPLAFAATPTDDVLALLDVGALALRRLGSGRNRGRGRVTCTLSSSDGQDLTGAYVRLFGVYEAEARL